MFWISNIAKGQESKPDSNFHIYLLMGQSNMAGRGPLSNHLEEHHDRVMVLNGALQWLVAHHPLHEDKPAVDGVGPGLSFGIELANRNPKVTIGLVPCAIGGSPIAHWLPGAFDPPTKTYPWDDAVKKINYAMKIGVIKGVIWHQGESDSRQELAVSYLKNLQDLIQRVRQLTGNPNLPFIAGELGRYFKQNDLINDVLKKLPASVPFTGVVSSEGLTDKGDKLHFNSESAGELGKRYAREMNRLQADSLAATSPKKISKVVTETGLNFQNPLISASRPDPYVAQKDGNYYFMYTRGDKLGLRKATSMSSLALAKEKVIWTPPTGTAYSSHIWAPELHFLSGKWYVYFAANDGGGESHRMYVLENENADPTTGTWTFKGKIADSTDQWAIDGSILTVGSTNYFMWSGWENVATKYKQYIYIAPMSNPWTISGSRVKISSPTNSWEKYEPSGALGAGVNEGPIMLQKDANSPVFIIYSASRYSSDNYCLAQIQLKSGGNPINAADWINKKQVFVKNDVNSVYGPGHNGFFTSSRTDLNGVVKSENWFIYHARSVPNATNGARTPRMQKITWNADGSPNFGVAIATGVDIPVPIGE